MVLLIGVLTGAFASAGTSYPTFHADDARTGWNARETVLSQDNAAELRRIADVRLDGEADAQPLLYRSTVYVATENDSIYAFDERGHLEWRRHFGNPVPVRYLDRCRATAPVIGIQGTPAIDAPRGRLIFVSFELVRGAARYIVRSIDLRNGATAAQRDITGLASPATAHRQRAGLALRGGTVYVAFGGFCDRRADVSYGRILAFRTGALSLASQFVTTADARCGTFHLGTIWQMGFAPAIDAQGRVYVATGNGCIDYGGSPQAAYGNAVLRLDKHLRLRARSGSYFASCDALRDNAHDQEMGSSGVVLLPGRDYAVAGGKNGDTYLLHRDDLGGYSPRCPGGAVSVTETSWGVWGGPVTWRARGDTFLAIAGIGPHGISVYRVGRGGRLSIVSETREPLENGGASLGVTSDEAASRRSVLLWALIRPVTGTMFLRAYDPYDLRRALVSVPAGSWSNPSGYAAQSPTVADGIAIVASDRRLTMWSIAGNAPLPYARTLILAAAILALGSVYAIRRGLRRAR